MATITIPGDLFRTAEECARQTGETPDQLITRLLAAEVLPAVGSASAENHSLAQAIASADASAEELRVKRNLLPPPADIWALRNNLQAPPDAD